MPSRQQHSRCGHGFAVGDTLLPELEHWPLIPPLAPLTFTNKQAN